MPVGVVIAAPKRCRVIESERQIFKDFTGGAAPVTVGQTVTFRLSKNGRGRVCDVEPVAEHHRDPHDKLFSLHWLRPMDERRAK